MAGIAIFHGICQMGKSCITQASIKLREKGFLFFLNLTGGTWLFNWRVSDRDHNNKSFLYVYCGWVKVMKAKYPHFYTIIQKSCFEIWEIHFDFLKRNFVCSKFLSNIRCSSCPKVSTTQIIYNSRTRNKWYE